MRIAFVGGGNMARAIIGGLISRGRQPSEILVVETDVIARSLPTFKKARERALAEAR